MLAWRCLDPRPLKAVDVNFPGHLGLSSGAFSKKKIAKFQQSPSHVLEVIEPYGIVCGYFISVRLYCVYAGSSESLEGSRPLAKMYIGIT